MIEYDVSKSAGTCCVTGRAINEDEVFYSALIETSEGFERRDYTEQAWQGPPEGALCFFKTRMPKKQEARRTFVDDDLLINNPSKNGRVSYILPAARRGRRSVKASVSLCPVADPAA